MHDLILIFAYMLIVLTIGMIIGALLPPNSWIWATLKAIVIVACLVMIVCALTGCMLVKCDNCTFHEPVEKAIEVKGKK